MGSEAGKHLGKRATRTLKNFALRAKENYFDTCNFAAWLILGAVAIIGLPFYKEIKRGHSSNT